LTDEGNDCLTPFLDDILHGNSDGQKDSLYFTSTNKNSKYIFPVENFSNRTLRIAFLYTPEALNDFITNLLPNWVANGVTIIDYINFYVEELNFIFSFSEINMKAVFAYASLTNNENPAYNMEQELASFRDSTDGKYDEIYEIEPMMNADVTVLLSNKGAGMASPYWITGFNSLIVKLSYLKRLTLPHELGHTLGCNHNIEEYNIWGRYIYNPFNAYGYCNKEGGYRDIMSYQLDGYNLVRMPFYSMPELDFANGMRGTYIYDGFWGMNTATNCWSSVMGNSTSLIARRADHDENIISRTVNSGTFSNHYDIIDVVAGNYVCESGSEVLMHARNSIILNRFVNIT